MANRQLRRRDVILRAGYSLAGVYVAFSVLMLCLWLLRAPAFGWLYYLFCAVSFAVPRFAGGIVGFALIGGLEYFLVGCLLGAMIAMFVEPPADKHNACPKCGYDLAGLARGTRCPECGEA